MTSEEDGYWILTIENGGEVADFIEYADDQPIKCPCGKMIGPCKTFQAYPHKAGLKDNDSARWWVFIKCKCGYCISHVKMLIQIKKQEQKEGCDIDNCPDKVYKDHLCLHHYKRSSLTPHMCCIDGCTEEAYEQDLCETHHEQAMLLSSEG